MVDIDSTTDCDKVCKIRKGEVADYDNFKQLNLTSLMHTCPTREFRVHIDYDWTDRAWKTAGGDIIKNIMWQSVLYPRKTDIITVCTVGKLVF